MEKQMDVGVNQSRKQRAVPKVDDFGSRGMLHRRSNLDDAVALNQNFTGLQHLPGLNIQQACRVQNDRVDSRGLAGSVHGR
jgi:hypothetical protein